MTTEDSAVGGVAWSAYAWYVRLGNGWLFLAMLAFALMAQAGFTISSVILARWSARQPVLSSLGEWSQPQYIQWMGIFTLIGITLLTVRQGFYARFILNVADNVHDALARNVLRAPTSFFDTTPMGRIINRFTKDMSSVDTVVSETLGMIISMFMTICGTIFLVCYSSVWLILIFPPLVIIFGLIYTYYSKTVRGIKRLDSVARSPMLAIMNEVVGGLSSIRVYQLREMVMSTHEERVLTALVPGYNLRAAQRWLSSRTELIGATIVFFVCLLGVLSKTSLKESLNLSPAIVALAVSNAISTTNTITFVTRTVADLETEMNSTERVKQYSEDIPQEAALAYKGEDGALPGAPAAPPKSWPATARVDLDEYSLRYRPGLPLVLRDLTFAIANKQKIGVVGRTGSGKSTLLLAIFRIVEAAGGRISIDGRDIATLKLADLRKAITIIPQDPMLFSGTVRSNLDPFGEHSDAAVWAVLDRLQLRPRLTTFITEGPSGLDAPVEEKGGNFSVGQRQLLCMARALLKRAPILMLDEATASVDFETDAMIQRLIREEFKDCTVITIAHRLATIIDSDKVLVLSHGDFVEYDAPSDLLRKDGGALRGMVERLGPDQFNMLLAIADGKAEVGGDVLQVDTAVH
jgi:ABC-type multidrug transport system fused ATPase/permease subunit